MPQGSIGTMATMHTPYIRPRLTNCIVFQMEFMAGKLRVMDAQMLIKTETPDDSSSYYDGGEHTRSKDTM